MPDQLHLIPASDEASWRRWMDETAHDFYHSAAYHRFSEQSGEGEAFLAVYGSPGRYLAWPYLLRPLDDSGGLRDITSVYGYAGPVACGCPPGDSFLITAHERITSLWCFQRAVTAFTRFHPLLDNHRWSPVTGVHFSGETVSLDLTLSDASHWRNYHASLRNRINRGRRLGMATCMDTEWRALDEFVRFYQAAMTRNRAASRYLFPAGYFRRLRDALCPNAFLMTTRLAGQLAAAAIIVEYRGIVQNHFSMNNPALHHLSPTKVLIDDVRKWAAARGNRVFHLGGGRGGTADSLFAFKAGFSPRRHAFHTGRYVLDPRLYDRLCGDIQHTAGTFFPAYRAAATAGAAASRRIS